MKKLVFAGLALTLSACNLGIVEVIPEMRDCSDTLITVSHAELTKTARPKECETGRMKERWAWE